MRKHLAFFSGAVALAIYLVLFIFEPPFLEAVSHQSFDALHKLTASPLRETTVTLVDIDEASLAKHGQWPWSRNVLAKLVDELWKQGTTVVGFDIAFPEADRLSPRHAQDLWRQIFDRPIRLSGIPDGRTDFDAEFAHALRQGHAVLGCYADWNESGTVKEPRADDGFEGHYYELGTPVRKFLFQADEMIQPLKPLTIAADGLGFINTTPDADNIVRRTPLVCAHGSERIYPSLALECFRLYRKADAFGVVYDDAGVEGVMHIRVGKHTIPTDANGRLVLNYRSERFPRISAYDVLRGAAPSTLLSNKIVIIGTSAAGLRDLKATPLYAELPGFEVQATALENMLSDSVLREPRWMFVASFITMIVLGLTLAFLIGRMGALMSLGMTFLAAGLVTLVSAWIFKSAQWVIPPAAIVLSFILIYIAVTVVNYWMEERERVRIRAMFGTMVSGEVLRYLEEHPDSFSLTGKSGVATVFFSDIAGFTSIAEDMSPEDVSRFMNRYLTPVTRVIMQYGGYVDKFFGDAVIAAWNVPYPEEQHALHACRAALEQQQAIAKLREELQREFGHILRVRMGINTGPVIAGNMGSEHRFNYTVLGEAVNLAARFESANRLYGTSIIIGEETKRQVRDHLAVRLLDKIIVRGESKPVLAYELLGPREELSSVQSNITALYEEALRLHWEQKWDQAEQCLDEIAQQEEEDAPSSMLRHRIQYYRENPPPASWQGEYALRQK